MKIIKADMSRIIVDATSKVNGVTDHRPGLLIELSSDDSLVTLYHFYYGRDGNMVCTNSVNIDVDDLDDVIGFLNEIKRKCKLDYLEPYIIDF